MSTKSKPPLLTGLPLQGARIEELKIRGPEDPEDKRLRRKKEFLAFLVKDLLAYVVAFLFIGAIATYCFLVLIRHGVNSQEAEKVWPIVSSILAGIVGMVFGRATK